MNPDLNQSLGARARDHRYAVFKAAGVATAASSARYTCPMHPEIVRDAPGSCPKCGMALVPAT